LIYRSACVALLQGNVCLMVVDQNWLVVASAARSERRVCLRSANADNPNIDVVAAREGSLPDVPAEPALCEELSNKQRITIS